MLSRYYTPKTSKQICMYFKEKNTDLVTDN